MLALHETYAYTVQVLVRYPSLHSFALVTNITILTAFLTSFHAVVNDSLHLTWAQYRSYTFLSVQIPCPELQAVLFRLYMIWQRQQPESFLGTSVFLSSPDVKHLAIIANRQLNRNPLTFPHCCSDPPFQNPNQKIVFAKIKISVPIDNQGMSY